MRSVLAIALGGVALFATAGSAHAQQPTQVVLEGRRDLRTGRDIRPGSGGRLSARLRHHTNGTWTVTGRTAVWDHHRLLSRSAAWGSVYLLDADGHRIWSADMPRAVAKARTGRTAVLHFRVPARIAAAAARFEFRARASSGFHLSLCASANDYGGNTDTGEVGPGACEEEEEE